MTDKSTATPPRCHKPDSAYAKTGEMPDPSTGGYCTEDACYGIVLNAVRDALYKDGGAFENRGIDAKQDADIKWVRDAIADMRDLRAIDRRVANHVVKVLQRRDVKDRYEIWCHQLRLYQVAGNYEALVKHIAQRLSHCATSSGTPISNQPAREGALAAMRESFNSVCGRALANTGNVQEEVRNRVDDAVRLRQEARKKLVNPDGETDRIDHR